MSKSKQKNLTPAQERREAFAKAYALGVACHTDGQPHDGASWKEYKQATEDMAMLYLSERSESQAKRRLRNAVWAELDARRDAARKALEAEREGLTDEELTARCVASEACHNAKRKCPACRPPAEKPRCLDPIACGWDHVNDRECDKCANCEKLCTATAPLLHGEICTCEGCTTTRAASVNEFRMALAAAKLPAHKYVIVHHRTNGVTACGADLDEKRDDWGIHRTNCAACLTAVNCGNPPRYVVMPAFVVIDRVGGVRWGSYDKRSDAEERVAQLAEPVVVESGTALLTPFAGVLRYDAHGCPFAGGGRDLAHALELVHRERSIGWGRPALVFAFGNVAL